MCDIELSSCLVPKEIDILKILTKRNNDNSIFLEEYIYRINLKFENEGEYKYNELKERQYFFNRKRRIYKVYLCNTPSKKLYDFIVNEWKMEISHFENSELIHRGHYIAKKFQKYLIPSEILAEKRKLEKENKIAKNQKLNKINHFFGIGNVLNISPQSAEANCGPYGQLIYERKVWNFLDGEKGEKREVYYEVEDIIIDGKISFGRRIKAAFFEGEIFNENESFHVFIPNIYRDK